MGVRSALRRWLADPPVAEAKTAAAPAPTPEREGFVWGVPRGGVNEVTAGIGAATQSDRRTQMQELYEGYVACPWSWASVNAISRTITAGGLVTDWDGDDEQGDQVPAKPANVLAMERLLAYCNPREDIRQLMRGVIADLLVFGDAFLEVVWVGTVPVALYSLDAPSMFPLADEHGTITGYVQVTEFGQRAEFEPREVIHISLDSPRSGLYGVSPTLANMLPITAWLFAASTAKEIFRKGNPPSIHVDFPNGISSTEMNRWDAMYAARNIGPRNIGTPIITKNGGKITELKQGSVVEYIDFLNQKRDEILAGYGVPPAQAGVIESGNLGGGTGESQRKMFLTNTCQPIAELVLEKLQFHIAVGGFGVTGWHLKFADVDMRDSETIEKIRDTRLRNGSWTLDRYRADIGEPPVPGGDQAVLVDRQNLVPWVDLAALARASIAMKLKGTSLDVDQPDPTKPVSLAKAAPAPATPPATMPEVPALDTQAPQPAGKKTKAGKNAAPPQESLDAEWQRLSEAWTQQYLARRRQALADLPLAEHAGHPGDTDVDHDHHSGPDYRPSELGVPALHPVTVDPATVRADHSYQRPLDHDKVEHLTAEPKDRLAGRVGLLAHRPDGTYWVVDGQHHTAAAVKAGIRKLTYQCFDSTGEQMEARVYAAWQRWDNAHHPMLAGARG